MDERIIIKTLREAQQEVKQRYKASLKGIFGSYAKGEEGEKSDIDILVEFEPVADLIHFVGLSLFLEELLSHKVDIVPYDTIREEIKENILRETIYL